jgi:hypothetical protein
LLDTIGNGAIAAILVCRALVADPAVKIPFSFPAFAEPRVVQTIEDFYGLGFVGS